MAAAAGEEIAPRFDSDSDEDVVPLRAAAAGDGRRGNARNAELTKHSVDRFTIAAFVVAAHTP